MVCYASPNALRTAIAVLLLFLLGKQGKKGISFIPWKLTICQVRLESSNLEHRSYRCFRGTGFLAFQHGANYSSNYTTVLAKILLLASKQITCLCPVRAARFQLQKKKKKFSAIWVRIGCKLKTA